MDDDDFLGIPEVARMLGVSTQTVYNLIWHGEIDGVRVARCQKISRAHVKAYIAAHTLSTNPDLRKREVPVGSRKPSTGRPRKVKEASV
jgi:excisionase family DNA binding protein